MNTSRLVSLSLVLAAAILVPLAFRERMTADFLVQVADHGWNGSSDARRAALETASSYSTVFWFDLALAAVLLLVATGIILRAGPWLYGLAGLVAGFAASAGVWVLLGDQAELHGGIPVGMLAVFLVVVATLAVIGSIAGWASTQPSGGLAPRLGKHPTIEPHTSHRSAFSPSPMRSP